MVTVSILTEVSIENIVSSGAKKATAKKAAPKKEEAKEVEAPAERSKR